MPFDKALYDAMPMLQLMDDVYHYCFKMQRVGDTDSWIPREGYTVEDNLRLMREIRQDGTLEGLQAMVESAKNEEAKK